MKPKAGKTKLTLSCSIKVIDEAKKYAASEEESLSAIVEEFLATYSRVKKNKASGKFSFDQPEITKLSGVFRLGAKRDYKKDYRA